MTSRERWLALLAGRPPDRIPCDYWGTEEVTQRLLVELGCASELELWERLSIDKLVHIGRRSHRLRKTCGTFNPNTAFGISERRRFRMETAWAFTRRQ